MKRILAAILITFLVSCNSNLKAEKQALVKENSLLKKELELLKNEQNSDTKNFETTKSKETKKPKEAIKMTASYTFDNFHISENRVGIFSKGMTIADLYNTIPKEQIKKKVGYGEFADDTYDDYEIYDSDGKKLLIVTPEQNGNTASKINRVSIVDSRFKTTEKIGLGSTFGALAKNYTMDDISPIMDHILLEIGHINARFTINKTELKDGWWNEKRIDISKIPDTAKFDEIVIWWD